MHQLVLVLVSSSSKPVVGRCVASNGLIGSYIDDDLKTYGSTAKTFNFDLCYKGGFWVLQ
jgi:hypothetical protein